MVKKETRKKITALLLSALAFCSLFSACSKEEEIYDMETEEEIISSSVVPALKNAKTVPDWLSGGETSTVFNELPEKVVIHIDLCALGDIMAHNGTYEAAYTSDGTYDFDYMFADIARYIVDADYSVGNLETVFAGKERQFSNYPNFNTPEQMAYSLGKVLDLDLVSMAGNHVFDRGYSGMLKTMEFLDEFGLAHTGAYGSQEDYDTPFIVDICGAKVAFISSTYGVNGAVPSDHPYAVRVTSKEKLKKCSDDAVAAGADFVVALLHWGNEYQSYASAQQQELSKWLFENTDIGLIIGNHAHVVQPIEVFDVERNGVQKRGTVLYALGNFTGEQLTKYRDGGIIARIGIDIDLGSPDSSRVTEIKYSPTYIDSNPKATGKRYRVITIYDAIEGYESGSDSLISTAEYNKMLEYRDFYLDLLCTHEIVSEYVLD